MYMLTFVFVFCFNCFDSSYNGNIPIPPPIIATFLYSFMLNVPYPIGPIMSSFSPTFLCASKVVPFPFTWNMNSSVPVSFSKL